MTPPARRPARLAARFGHATRRVSTALLGTLAISLPALLIAIFAPGPASASAPPPSAEELRWQHTTVHGRHLPDPRQATPWQVARFFAGRPAAEQARLARDFPQVVGNLNGAPLALRYAANGASIQKAGPGYPGWSDTDRRFLAFDLRGTGRAAEVVGDLAHADHIAVVVPGVGNSIHDFDRPGGPNQHRYPATEARSLYQETQQLAPRSHTAVIAWLGYQPPSSLGRDAAREETARTGAAELDQFLAGLTTVRPGAAIMVVGHSYGSVVSGVAAHAMPSRVTDIVAVGSPGMGVERAADLHSPARVWAGLAPDDWISDVPGVQLLGVGHGTDPSDPRFGARTLPVAGVRTHDQYLDPATGSLRAIGWIATGHPERVGA